MIKIIFFDIDGTLRPFETGRIPESTKQAVRKAREAGILTCIATGRHWLELHAENLIEELPFDAFVTLDGNYCYTLPEGSGDLQHERLFSDLSQKTSPAPFSPLSSLHSSPSEGLSLSELFDAKNRTIDCYFDPHHGEILHNTPIPPKSIRSLMEFLETNPYPVIFEEERSIYVNYVNDDLRQSFAEIHSVIPPLGNPENALKNPVFMLIPIMPYADSLQLAEHLPDCQIVRWSDGPSFDMTPRGITKVSGIERILHHYGMDRSEAAAIGDGLNDTEMLEHVGLGIAMGNAKEECKRVADYVSPHIMENGLSHAVDYILRKNTGLPF